MSEINSSCLLFVGPSLIGTTADALQSGIELQPPVRRGDIESIVATRAPGVVAIADGLFHQCLSVGHAEIRSAVARGWQVWGLSSMGAIRAYEMRHMGVRGYGCVYRYFCQDDDFRDDEVALLHGPRPAYRALSEPLVHIRLWFRELSDTGLLSARQERQLLDDLMSMWYGDRTLLRVRSMILELIPEARYQVEAMLADFDRFRVKCHDLSQFLQEQPWKNVRRFNPSRKLSAWLNPDSEAEETHPLATTHSA